MCHLYHQISEVFCFSVCRLLAVLVSATTSNVPNKLVASNSNAISQGTLKLDIHGIQTLVDYAPLDCCMEH